MKLARKIELAKQAISSITRHDDAPEDEVVECGRILSDFLKAEIAEAGKRRTAQKAARLAALEDKRGVAH